MKLSSGKAISCLVAEGINNYEALLHFDKKTLQYSPTIFKEKTAAIVADASAGITAEASVASANISLISVQRIIIASNVVKYYTSVD